MANAVSVDKVESEYIFTQLYIIISNFDTHIQMGTLKKKKIAFGQCFVFSVNKINERLIPALDT